MSKEFAEYGQPLTRREREALALLIDGLTNQEIAARMYVSAQTVKNYLTCIYRKLGVANRVEAVVLTLRREAA